MQAKGTAKLQKLSVEVVKEKKKRIYIYISYTQFSSHHFLIVYNT